MAFQLSRNARLYISTVESDHSINNTWEIPIQDGFSFSQGNETQEITLNESGATPQRGSVVYNTSLAPAEFSFTTYVRPYYQTNVGTAATGGTSGVSVGAGGGRAFGDNVYDSVDKVLWASLTASNAVSARQTCIWRGTSGTAAIRYSGTCTGSDQAGALGSEGMCVCAGVSNAHELIKLNMYFVIGDVTYKMTGCQINQADVDFSIDGIALITWSGFGRTFIDGTLGGCPIPVRTSLTSGTCGTAGGTTGLLGGGTWGVQGNCGAREVPAAADYIRNKLSTLNLRAWGRAQGGTNGSTAGVSTAPNSFTETDKDYTLAITGGTITYNNNITYITPDNLATVDSPIGSFTGSRSITGNLTAYLNSGTDGSEQLLADLAGASTDISNHFGMNLNMGGTTAPYVAFAVTNAQLNIPTTEISDVVGVSIDFKAQGYVGGTAGYGKAITDVSDPRELSVRYVAQTTSTAGSAGCAS